MPDKKLNIQRYKRSAKGVLEFAKLIETAPAELRERIIAQTKEDDPEFLASVMKQVGSQGEPPKELRLDRFKRDLHGQVEFASLLEQSTPQVRELILERAKAQDPKFIEEVLIKTVFFEELMHLDEGVLAEVLSETPAKILAYALFGMSQEFREVILAAVSHLTKKQVQEEEEDFGKGPAEGLILGARRQILKIGRNLEAQNKFTFEVPDAPRLKKSDANAA